MADAPFLWHPLLALSPAGLGWLLVVLLAGSAVLFVRLEAVGRRLRTDTAPLGIVSLELCLSVEESRAVIESWDEAARVDARTYLCWDYFFIPLYTTALAILGIMASRWFAAKGLDGLATLAMILAWGQWIAGLFDFTENSTLIRILSMHPTIPPALPRLAGWCARMKFLCVLLGLLCCLMGLVTAAT